MADSLLQTARRYVSLGFSVVPVKLGTKKPDLPEWTTYQQRLPTDAELVVWFSDDARVGIGIVCGKVSGNLEVIDFDNIDAYISWGQAVEAVDPAPLSRLPRVKTPGGGRHVYVRRAVPPRGNRKLAQDEDRKVLVETRGEGGFVVAPGSPAACHPSGRLYEWEVEPAACVGAA